jgi:hypothetical protein
MGGHKGLSVSHEGVAGDLRRGERHRVSRFRRLPLSATASTRNGLGLRGRGLDFGWRRRLSKKAVHWRGPAGDVGLPTARRRRWSSDTGPPELRSCGATSSTTAISPSSRCCPRDSRSKTQSQGPTRWLQSAGAGLTAYTLHANGRTKNISSARQFQRRASPIGDGRAHLSITRRGPRQWEGSYGSGQHDKRNRVAAFQLSLRQRKHNLPDQLRVHPRSDRNEIA